MKALKEILVSAAMLLPMALYAQTQSPEEQQKQFQENIDKEIERYEEILSLSGSQTFFVDSILNHDYKAMQDEMMALSRQKMSNQDIYMMVQDKWMERMYVSFRRILSDEQWEKYLKTGALKAKKSRDKREEKRNQK